MHVLTVTVASRPSGTLATMIPMRKMTASSQEYPKMMDRMKKDTPRKTATPVMMWIKCSISLAMGVFPVSSPEVSVAMRPITVRSPVQTTIPRAVPDRETNKSHTCDLDFYIGRQVQHLTVANHEPSTQLVEKKAMLRVSRGLSWVQSGDLVWGSDSPVREELSTYVSYQRHTVAQWVAKQVRFLTKDWSL